MECGLGTDLRVITETVGNARVADNDHSWISMALAAEAARDVWRVMYGERKET